mmetsp:Transcript_23821/g.39770  ORF Transcript_23821/g.39770 Transcript_23821/m.39770 type:complete len:270 (-) Transcript_23821:226-1035(-)|eukprot:CAMPEP_0174971124 /NCGR_PEP_ID=MMETSP0004_2-20121128/9799_1 /TAXON_ID=420556 /ORGANISM="Ochromonas sp., Strain CCMP1393" /LENGTH=269 /DNA_ID=CAMNT_0016221001 /DNA_START=194 /DNA_END=1003 /DNA_ORIENTATION=-
MIRNQMIPMMDDPEGTPDKSHIFSGVNAGQNQLDDPWYTNSANDSPTSDYANSGGQARTFEYNNYGNSNSSSNNYGAGGKVSNDDVNRSLLQDEEDYSNEPPLLEELGIHFDHILLKTQAVLNPHKQIHAHILDDADLAGPLCFCLLLGSCLLLSGKVQFGYIYGFSVFGCLALQGIVNLIHPVGLDFWRTCSVLGYCLLPVIGLAAVGILMRLNGVIGLLLSLCVIAWATISATRLIDAKLALGPELYYLVAYPIMLLYACFVIITIF